MATLFIIAVLNLVFSIGTSVSPVVFEQQATRIVEPTVECRLVERHTVQYIEKPVTVVEYVERTQKIPVELRNFSDVEELRQWLAEMDMNATTTYFQSPGVTIDCDDYALDMQHKALADGYIMSFEVISRGEYNSIFESKLLSSQDHHAISLVIIGNDAYYIEPQTSEISFATHLD
ncbi:hypothetical protein ACFLX8_04375 [Chloroflexota bacterium]